ncbi:MAG: type II toxin-antitoxin system VapC family toxin [Deltaproteobacteria bacterium]|nr:type II toxin-antitoxin system VapC family toxin [Deltaproteobacteria bacterium]
MDWIIHYLNGNRKVVEKLRSLKGEGLSISIISLAELYEGIYYSTNPELPILTNNRRHYEMVEGLKILSFS